MGSNDSASRLLEKNGVTIVAPAKMPNCELARTLAILAEYVGKCESPAEGLFLSAMHDAGLVLSPQYEVGKYRLDFAAPQLCVGVEIDGHEWHKTAEQRTNDARKDRWLLQRGWLVMRFTGHEIRRDAARCVREVTEILDELAAERRSVS